MTALRGSTADFPLEAVIGLVADASKTGELQIRGGERLGALGFANGRLVAAVMDGEGGENALGAIFAIREGEFEFTPWASAPDANLEEADLSTVLKRAAEARDRFEAIRAQIPDDRMRFKLSERAADHGAVTFTPDRWRALLAVNGERDVLAIAEQLRLGRMETLTLLSGLVKEEVIETIAPPAAAERPESNPSPRVEAPPPAVEPPADRGAAGPAPFSATAPSEWSAGQTAPQATPSSEWEVPLGKRSSGAAEPPTKSAWRAASNEPRDDLNAEIAARFGDVAASDPAGSSRSEASPGVDDRLSSLTGVFAPGPAANAPSGPAVPEIADPWAAPPPSPPTARSADSWAAPPPAASEAPANAWAPTATQPQAAMAESTGSPAAAGEAHADRKRGGGLFSMFRRDEPTPIPQSAGVASGTSRPAMLASFANALLTEFGAYGKGKMETRMASLLMRVDEQADPIDRPLPIVDDQIDATALERDTFPEEQLTPYLATLVRQIYEDAERTFGKDKARKGYKTAQQQVFGADTALLQSSDLAGKLPKV